MSTSPPTDIYRGIYAIQARQLLDVIDRIRDVKGELTELELPRIAVIGKQSAGKSSLIEGFARVDVPRGSGTCTRCPTEIRLRCTQEEWQCTISLKLEHDMYGNKLPDKIEPIPFGNPITDRTQLEINLRRAQLAVLDPERHPAVYLDVDPYACSIPDTQVKFSRNVICVEISGPELTDLTLVDLPGMIQNDVSNGGVDKMIEAMIREYISDKATLILATVTMNDDPENQAVLKEARDADPKGRRTIGVLTKPDLMQEGDEHLWLPLLKNEGPHKLDLGYYVVKQRSVKELEERLSFEAARAKEIEFFSNTPFWKTLPAQLQGRLGTPNLTAKLSSLLIELTRQFLPGLIEKIHSSLEDVYDTLSHIDPELSDNPVGEMIRLVERFSAQMRGHLLGARGCKNFIRSNRATFLKFKELVRCTAPFFVPLTREEIECMQIEVEVIEPDFIAEDFHDFEKLKKVNLNQVREVIQQEVTGELPFNVPFEAKANLMLLPIKQWKALVLDCFDQVHPRAVKIEQEVTAATFGRFDQGHLLHKVRTIVAHEVNARVRATRSALEELLKMERMPMSFNDAYYTSLRDDLLTHYRHKRRLPVKDCRSPEREHITIGQLLSQLAELGYADLRESDLAKLHKADDWEEEITVMAETRAYFQVSFKRIIDSVPQIINHFFVRSLEEAIQNALVTGLGIDSREAYERCKDLLIENPSLAAKRRMMEDRRARLEKAKEALSVIGY